MKTYPYLYCILTCSLLLLTSCMDEIVSVREEETPLENQLTSWLSSDYFGNEIVMFITDNDQTFRFRSSDGEELKLTVEDVFVVKSISGDTCIASITVSPHHVGVTRLHIRNDKHDTTLSIRILPEFYTYPEPTLDFDDTYDSVMSKIMKFCTSYSYVNGSRETFFIDSPTKYTLQISYSTDSTIDHYSVALRDQCAEDELSGFIEERYYRTTAQYDGNRVYIKAFNKTSPSISDATVIVIPDFNIQKINYQNPVTYNN